MTRPQPRHDDIAAVLTDNDNRWMAPDIIAMAVSSRRLFQKPAARP